MPERARRRPLLVRPLSGRLGVRRRGSWAGWILLCAVIAEPAAALGIGGLRVQSALNQPMVGEIDLLDVRADELDTVKVQIAPKADFEKVGAERYHYLTKLRFSAQPSSRGNPVIRVSSQEPVREPYMDFLVEVIWPQGRLVRQFTLLLDPPSTTTRRRAPPVAPPEVPARRVGVDSRSDSGAASGAAIEAPPPVAPPAARPAEEAQPPAAAPPRPPRPPAPRPAVGSPPEPAADGLAQTPDAAGFPVRFGPVRPGTGLWRLARSKTLAGATVSQTAMALYRSNPDAFAGGNINRLRTGETLVLPSAAELFALSPEAAKRDFATAMAGGKVGQEPLAGTAAAAPVPGTPGGEPLLRIAGAAGPGGPAATPAPAAGPAAGEGEGLEKEVLLARETSETARQETVELRGRIQELEGQLQQIRGLLQVRGEELARLQGGAGTGPGGAAGPSAGADGQAGGTADLAGPGAPRPAVVPPTEAPATESPPGPSPAPEEPPVPASGDAAWQALLLPLLGVLGVTGLGIGVLLWLRARRRRPASSAVDGAAGGERLVLDLDLDQGLDQGLHEHRGGATPAPDLTSAALVDIVKADQVAPNPPSVGLDLPETEEAAVLAEAEIYINYGRLKEAEAILLQALARTPDRLDLKFKLAEAYQGSGNREALARLMEEIQAASGDREFPGQWQRLQDSLLVVPAPESRTVISPMGGGKVAGPGAAALLPEDSLFRARSEIPEGADFVLPDAPSASPPGPAASGLDQDFDLGIEGFDAGSGLVLETAAPAPAAAPAAATITPAAPVSPPAPAPAASGGGERTEPRARSGSVDSDSFWAMDGADWDEVAAKLDLARAYLEMGDRVAAQDLLQEVLAEGREEQKAEARALGAQDLDEVAAKLDLARAYLEMGDRAAAHDLLEEVLAEGREDQKAEARALGAGDLDAVAAQLDLARAYLEMGDRAAADDLLHEVLAGGNEDQKAAARALLAPGQ